MKEHPILFSGGMVRAILAGRKTQTRRILKPQPYCNQVKQWLWEHKGNHHPFHPELPEANYPGTKLQHVCPFGKAGDRLWVRETFSPHPEVSGTWIYRADRGGDYQGSAQGYFVWKPSIFMPRSASRLTLEIVSVRVEHLQDISEEDAKAEGVPDEGYAVHYYCDDGDPNDPDDFGAHRCNWRFGYKMLWNEINGQGSWDKNPWVWVIEFKPLTSFYSPAGHRNLTDGAVGMVAELPKRCQ